MWTLIKGLLDAITAVQILLLLVILIVVAVAWILAQLG